MSKNQGYGDVKQWNWTGRTDIATVGVDIDGVVKLCPFTVDTSLNMEYLSFEFTYSVANFGFWSINLHIGIYKAMKGIGGTVGWLELVHQKIFNWTGFGGIGTPVVVYDGSTATSATAIGLETIVDGAYYWAVLATYTGEAPLAITTTFNCQTIFPRMGAYLQANLTGQTSLPTTITKWSNLTQVRLPRISGIF